MMKHKIYSLALTSIAICCLAAGCGSGQRNASSAVDSSGSIQGNQNQMSVPAKGGSGDGSGILEDFSPEEMLHEYHEEDYTTNEDGTYTYCGVVYRYKLLYKEKLPSSIREYVYVVLSNSKDLTYDEVSDAGNRDRGEGDRLKCALIGSGFSKLSPENTEEDASNLPEDALPKPDWEEYTANADGTYTCEGITYQYKLLLTGVYRTGACGTRMLVLSNQKDLTCDDIHTKRLSSQMEETLQPSECVVVGEESIPAENYIPIPLPENGTIIK